MKKKILLWIDDLRDPFYGTWIEEYSPIGKEDITVIWVKNYTEFTNYINSEGMPDAICFDHDLGDDIMGFPEDEKTGYDCAKFLVDYCMDHDSDIPLFNIQSSNPAGALNIKSLLDNYHNFYTKTHDVK